MSAKTKKILSAIAAIVILAVLAIIYLKKPTNETPAEPTESFSLDTIASNEDETTKDSGTSSGETTRNEAGEESEKATKPAEDTTKPESETTKESGIKVDKNGTYSDKEHVAAYIHQYGCLPSNYITKDEAEDLGWVSSKGNLNKVAPGKSIGGDYFGNYEKILPVKKGRKYYECDIDYKKGSRNAKRIIYSSDGLVYYTEDHYETFTLLYGEE